MVSVGIAGVALMGCMSRPEPGKVLPAPPPPPAYPAATAVPIDPALRAAAQKELAEASHAADPFVRAHAIEAAREVMGGVGSAASLDQGIILRGLTDREPVVRFAALMAAGELRVKDARGPALSLANDADVNVRVAARFCLHRLGDTRLSHDLEKTVRDMDPHLRCNTVVALGRLGEPSALKVLRATRKDPDAIVRLQVAEAMWRLGDEDGLNTLVGYTISRYPDDRMVSLLALAGPRDSRVSGHLYGSLTTEWAEVNLVAARGLGMLGSDAGYGVAMTNVKSTDPRLRHLAALALGAIGRSDAQPMLADLLKDAEPDVRLAAATALLELKRS
jgi:HEAT repeat protein